MKPGWVAVNPDGTHWQLWDQHTLYGSVHIGDATGTPYGAHLMGTNSSRYLPFESLKKAAKYVEEAVT